MTESVFDPMDPLNNPTARKLLERLEREDSKWLATKFLAAEVGVSPSQALRVLKWLSGLSRVQGQKCIGMPGKAPYVWRRPAEPTDLPAAPSAS